jgi:hypothetical protein
MTEQPFITTAIQLRNGICFHIEPYQNRVRLVLRKDDEEWICRREGFVNLYSFLNSEGSRLFKGRLQLVKQQDHIQVLGKGSIIGPIKANWLKDRLDELQNSSASPRKF